MNLERLEQSLLEMKKGIPNPGIGFGDIGRLIEMAKLTKDWVENEKRWAKYELGMPAPETGMAIVEKIKRALDDLEAE